jgi:hypothetical protein
VPLCTDEDKKYTYNKKKRQKKKYNFNSPEENFLLILSIQESLGTFISSFC